MSIIEKLEKQERLNYEDAIKLYDLDLFTLASFANKIREQRHGKKGSKQSKFSIVMLNLI